ncbi:MULTISPECIES: ATP-dependent DNA helicase [Bacillus subtilis group]|nr:MULTISPECIES: helicase C-terminal domain-containing protein [Bacillus subtilis group]MEC2189678.1 helicase C-terminal domain-containing protein [Bacillus spizizenii]MEC2297041.1 helicase C-terminal domain-containing protein [Bacillus subtilis]
MIHISNKGESMEARDILKKIFSEEGPLSKYFDGYKPRGSQIKMANFISDCLHESKHGLVEAGTGTGKSLGYSIAAALYSIMKEKTVVLCTHTITLQNQLVYKDLPLVSKVIHDTIGVKFYYALAKGRSHYICKTKLENYINSALTKEKPYIAEAKALANQLGLMHVGDRDEASVDLEIDDEFWQEIMGNGSDCLGSDSNHYHNCFIQEAKQNVKNAQVIVCNHALFFTDLRMKERGLQGVLPDYDVVIFDEGHRIEDVFSNHYQKSLSYKDIENRFDYLIKRKPKWARNIEDEEIQDRDIDPDEEKEVGISDELLEYANECKIALLGSLKPVFQAIAHEMKKHKKKDYLIENRLVSSLKQINFLLNNFIQELKVFKRSTNLNAKTNYGLGSYIQSIEELKTNINQLLLNQNTTQWANWMTCKINEETVSEYDLFFKAAPITCSSVLSKGLFSEKTVIIASATLTTAGDFSFVAGNLGISSYESIQIETPFNYKEQALLIVPANAPNPRYKKRENGTKPKLTPYDAYTLRSCKEVLEYTRGRTLILFTSFTSLITISKSLEPWCNEKGITVLKQEPGSSREKLLSQFTKGKNAVLLGAESFWEGVDIPGEQLSCVIIVKIPFPVPSEPIALARMSKLEDAGRNPFYEYSLPLAIIKMMQGFGRLIRRTTDKGAVIILDPRLIESKYGDIILNSLPETKFSDSLMDIKLVIQRGVDDE